jgi:hypothetical protein
MNQDLFYFDISNQNSNEQHLGNSDIFNDINYDILNNLKHQSSQYFNPFSFNNSQPSNCLNKFKNEGETELDEEKDIKNIKINNINTNIINNNYFYQINNIDNNNYIINNTVNNNKCICQCLKYNQLFPVNFNENYNKILQYEDHFFNSSVNIESNAIRFNKDNSNYLNFNYIDIDEDSKSNNISFSLSNNINNNDDNKDEINTDNFYNIELKSNKIINNNSGNENGKIDLNNNKKALKRKNNSKTKNKNLLGMKRKEKKRKKENKNQQIIQYGHPQKMIYKTIKQKLNIHKKLDPECRKDTFLLIYTISKVKNIIKDEELKGNIKDKINLQRIKDLYKNSILSLEHREYAQDITGFKLI